MKIYIKKYIFTYLIFPLRLLSMEQIEQIIDIREILNEASVPNLSFDENNADNITTRFSIREVDPQKTMAINGAVSYIQENFLSKGPLKHNISQLLSFLATIPEEIYPEVRFENGATPLHLVAQAGLLAPAITLVEQYRFNPLCKDDNGETPIDYARNNKHTMTTNYLRNAVNAVYANEYPYLDDPDTPTEENLETFKSKICEQLELLDTRRGTQSNILAIIEKTPEKVYLNARFENGATLLHLAAAKGAGTLVTKLLRRYNFSCFTKDNNGQIPIDYIPDDGSARKSIHRCLQTTRVERLKNLNAEQTMTQCQNERIPTRPKPILHLAAAAGSLYACKFLIEGHGHDIFMCDDHGKTPLEYATENRHTEIIKYLEQNPRMNYAREENTQSRKRKRG